MAKSDKVLDPLRFGSSDPVRIRNETDEDPQHSVIVYMAFCDLVNFIVLFYFHAHGNLIKNEPLYVSEVSYSYFIGDAMVMVMLMVMQFRYSSHENHLDSRLCPLPIDVPESFLK